LLSIAQRDNQAAMLEKMPEKDRKHWRIQFSIGNAAYIYHNQTSEEVIPTKADYEDWLVGLPEQIREDMKEKGFEECKTVLSFTRHVMERNDIGMDAWMEKHLSAEELEFWKSKRDKYD